jgi:penicillin-binding protein 2
MNLLVQRSDVGEFRRRFRWLIAGMLVAFLLLVGKLVQLQIVEGAVHREQARRNIVGEIRLATTRGVIRDAFGRVLAANRPSYNVYVVPEVLDLKETWPRVVQLMQLDAAEAEELRQKIQNIQGKSDSQKSQQTLLKVDVSRDVVAALKTNGPIFAASTSHPYPRAIILTESSAPISSGTCARSTAKCSHGSSLKGTEPEIDSGPSASRDGGRAT